METKIPVREIMSTKVVSSQQDETVQKVAHRMKDNEVGSTIIMSGDEVVGIVTERDIVRKVVAKDMPVDRVKAEEIMTSPIIEVVPDLEINEVARKMRKNEVKKLPVVDNGKVMGVVTQSDLIAVTPEFAEILSELSKFGPATESTEWSSGICEVCGSFVESLEDKGGKLVCESCAGEYGE